MIISMAISGFCLLATKEESICNFFLRPYCGPYWWHWVPIIGTLDSIKVVFQVYHGNVFIGNHCKLCSVVSDEPEFHEHISESFHIYSELDKLILAKRFLTKVEILSVKELCMEFGKFTVNFPNETVTRKM